MEINVIFSLSEPKIDGLKEKLEIPIGALVARFHPKKPVIALATDECDESRLVLYNIETGERREAKLRGNLRGLDVSDNLIAVAGPQIGVRLYDLSLNEKLRIEDLPLGTRTSRVKFTREGLLVSSNEGLHYFSLEGEKIREKSILEVQAIDAYGFLIAAASGNEVYLIDLEAKERGKYSLESFIYSVKLVNNKIYAGSDGLYKISGSIEKILGGEYIEDISRYYNYLGVSVSQEDKIGIIKSDRLERSVRFERPFSIDFHPSLPMIAVSSQCGKTKIFEATGSYKPKRLKKYVLRLRSSRRKYKGVSLARRLVHLGLLFYNAPVEALKQAAEDGIIVELLRTAIDEGLMSQVDASTFYSKLEPETLRGLDRGIFDATDIEEILREESEEILKRLEDSIDALKDLYKELVELSGDEEAVREAFKRLLEKEPFRVLINVIFES